MSVTYTAVLPVSEPTVERLTSLLETERRRRGTRAGRRALCCFDQAVLVLRWFLDAVRVSQLAVDHGIGKSTCYAYLHEGIDVLADQAPDLGQALWEAYLAGHEHVSVDGTLIETDRISEPGPTLRKGSSSGRRVDLWWSGKHRHHGGNVQVVTVPDGFPIWTSDVRPGREHDTKALRTHEGVHDAFTGWTSHDLAVLGDLGYEGQAPLITTATKTPAGGTLTEEHKTANKAHNTRRALGERGNALLKTTFKALRRVTLCPWRIGAITAAALVLLQLEHRRTA
ncbi:transposase family protein [Nocardia sp. alder85J]|uniref:transposase family protein n=1 Tax=Nocardia sp. alder85J TaxID=2862949 RepID=UPI001CD356F3|nr:transposase family protein [Nocardia sp. alder85J]MCX4095281.1 transposase [Nocardia sp. alder85J]MCX4095529.1 transposase [Nocardia sp. alder85J]MCX4096369.1 transposase [Nocardia sp. alder85J]MCX4098659.1 transposase [Nocardia sp. alder85J]